MLIRPIIDVECNMGTKLTVLGGFVGTRTEVWTATDGELELAGSIYPDDKSRRQVFPQVSPSCLVPVAIVADERSSVCRPLPPPHSLSSSWCSPRAATIRDA